MEENKITKIINKLKFGKILLEYQKYIDDMYGETGLIDERDIYHFLTNRRHKDK